jgi:glycosyltransferase involved in cell wall biosynthesis
MRKLIKESEADIFHIHDWSPYLNYKAASAPKKSVLTLHNLENKYIGSKIQNYVAKNAPKATAVSKWLNDRTYTTKVIYNGVDLEKFQVSEKTDNYALFVGSLTERKGALEIAKACQSQDIDLKMVGTGPLESKLSQMDVELLGNVEEEDLIQIYAKSDFLALPSRKEGFGLVWGEALSSGKPVLATKTGFGAEIPEYCGEILDPKYKLEQLKKSLDDLRNRGFETNRIRGFAEKNLEWDKITSDYLKVYRSL